MKLGKTLGLALGACVLAACGQQPIKPSESHLKAGERPPGGAIPPAVQVAPVLPAPQPTTRPETYSVVVNNVRVHELLFALARDARINVDIHPDVVGAVTLNAIDQTLQQLLDRIARQVDMRYEMHGDNLLVMRDSPFLRAYRIDYLSATRNVKMQSTASTQFGTAGAGGAAAAATATGATAQIDVTAENKLWESVVQNVRDILKETDRVPGALAAAPVPQPQPAPSVPGGPVTLPSAPPPTPVSYQEAASVIGNRESGILYVRASAKQHEQVQEFLDQVLAGAKRQVLIEATVAEVQLRNEYQRGIEWEKVRTGGNGTLTLRQPALVPPASFNPNPFLVGFVSQGGSFDLTFTLLEQFGDVRVLSSPKLSVLNNQTAILRVTRDIIYFTITPSTQPISVSGGGVPVIQPSFTTTPNVAAEGFMMTVLPFINDNGAIVLNVKPTIRRRVADAEDPNPALIGGTPNIIPVFETREFDSILRLRSGEIAVLAGLMQDTIDNRETGIPGIRHIPILGELLAQKADLTTKTELVIFLRATVIRDPSLDGDFRQFRTQLPREDFFARPNPGKAAPPVWPGGAR